MKRKYDRWDSAIRNNRTYDYYFYRLRDLAISRYKWHNLPDSVDERFLELCLFDKGMCVFFKDEVLNYLCLNVAISGQLNVYNLPTKRRAYATTGYNKSLNYDDSVIIFNNFSHTPSIADIHYFCDKLYLIDRTIDINTNAQKTPILLLCNEKQRLSLKNFYMKYDGNEPFIFGDKAFSDFNEIKALNTEAKFNALDLYELKKRYWNEALTYCGIDNLTVDKQERVISDEVQSSMGDVVAQRYVGLSARQQAAEQINRMFDLDISVTMRSTNSYQNDTGVVEDEQVYD